MTDIIPVIAARVRMSDTTVRAVINEYELVKKERVNARRSARKSSAKPPAKRGKK